MVIQFHSYRKLHPDDFVLMFACLTFIASQTLIYTSLIRNMYWVLEIGYNVKNPRILAMLTGDPDAFWRQFLLVQKTEAARSILTWTSIFAVKICFLLFFYPLITSHRKWLRAWKVIFGLTILLWAFSISSNILACPHFNKASRKLAMPPHIIQHPYKLQILTNNE